MENNNLFSSPGLSSPVILIFMAIGVCCAAGISFFAWRRFLLAHNPTVFQNRNAGPRYWMENSRDFTAIDMRNKPVVFDLWTQSGDKSTYFDWGRVSPLSVTLKTTTGTEKTHTTHKEFSLPPSSLNITTDHLVQPTHDIQGTAQVALSIVFPDEYRKVDRLGQYAIGVTMVDVIAAGKKS